MPVAGAGLLTTIVPVLTLQFGCSLTLATGVAGAAGCGFITKLRGVEVQLSEVLLAEIVCDPEFNAYPVDGYGEYAPPSILN